MKNKCILKHCLIPQHCIIMPTILFMHPWIFHMMTIFKYLETVTDSYKANFLLNSRVIDTAQNIIKDPKKQFLKIKLQATNNWLLLSYRSLPNQICFIHFFPKRTVDNARADNSRAWHCISYCKRINPFIHSIYL